MRSLTGGITELDDFSACKITRKEDWVELFAKPYYFGCEADDRTNATAFGRGNPFGAKLNAIYSSDIGHFDVIDIRDPLPEAYELVEDLRGDVGRAGGRRRWRGGPRRWRRRRPRRARGPVRAGPRPAPLSAGGEGDGGSASAGHADRRRVPRVPERRGRGAFEQIPYRTRIAARSTYEALERGSAVDPDAPAIHFLSTGEPDECR